MKFSEHKCQRCGNTVPSSETGLTVMNEDQKGTGGTYQWLCKICAEKIKMGTAPNYLAD